MIDENIKSKKIHLVLADDHPVVLCGLQSFFGSDCRFVIDASCPDGIGALNAIVEFVPDIAILDSEMPGMTGLCVAKSLREKNIPTKVILFPGALSEKDVIAAVHLGIEGIVLKEMSLSLLMQCINKISSGGQWLERHSTIHALGKLNKMLCHKEKESQQARLSTREIMLLQLVAGGLRNKEIGDKLCISEGTVKSHLNRIFKKLEVKGRMALLRYAQEQGLVDT